jgi:hypothetical protein
MTGKIHYNVPSKRADTKKKGQTSPNKAFFLDPMMIALSRYDQAQQSEHTDESSSAMLRVFFYFS